MQVHVQQIRTAPQSLQALPACAQQSVDIATNIDAHAPCSWAERAHCAAPARCRQCGRRCTCVSGLLAHMAAVHGSSAHWRTGARGQGPQLHVHAAGDAASPAADPLANFVLWVRRCTGC